MKMKAAVAWEKDAALKIEEVELASPKSTEVLVKLVGVGVCHTDACAINGMIPVQLPLVLGHEGAGIVEAVGDAVRDVKVGDHVVLSYYSCGHCERCRQGEPNMCLDYERVNFGGTYADGTCRISKDGKDIGCFFGQSSFAEYAVTDEENCVVIDKDVDLGIMGPLGCGIQTGAGAVSNKLKPEAGSSKVVFGCGAVGLSALMMASACGCAKVIAVDTVDSRLDMARTLGATHVINGKNADAIEEIRKITGVGADYSLDTTAVPAVMLQAIRCLKRKGTCAVVGSSGDKTVPIMMMDDIMGAARTLVGVVEGDSVPKLYIPKLIELYKLGKFPFDKLIKEYRFEEINQAFEDSRTGKTIKPIIRF